MSDRFDVRGLRTVVTGAASGLGLAIAEAMAEGGAQVTLVDVDSAGLSEAASSMPGARTAVVDVADSAAVSQLFAHSTLVGRPQPPLGRYSKSSSLNAGSRSFSGLIV